MTISRRELRQQRETTPLPNDIRLDPEVLRAVAKKMRERNPEPHGQMPSKIYILNSAIYEFIAGLEAVADDIQPAIRFVQQEEKNGKEGRDGFQ